MPFHHHGEPDPPGILLQQCARRPNLSPITGQLSLTAADCSSQIDVTLPETIAGVGALVTAGVLTAADQATLLAP
jgi:hypothetical protein